MYIDDAVMADVCLGNRLGKLANAWGERSRTGLGKTSVSETKKEAEGEWADEQIIFGHHVIVVGEAIVLPKSNIDGAERLVGGESP